jgi:protein tyrosine/serine phosphatase
MLGTATEPPPRLTAASRPRQLRARLVLLSKAVLAGLVVTVTAEAGRVFLGRNFHTLVPGRAYRCAQPTGAALEKWVRSYGIKTVINLRGCAPPWPWYLDECRVAHRLGVAVEDVCLSAGRMPPVDELRRLVEIMDRSAYPVLLHCRQGADRTGLAAAVLLLLQTDATLDQARRQLSLRYGHVALGRPANLDRLLDLYSSWLGDAKRTHSPDAFRAWLAEPECPGDDRCRLELLDYPARIPADEPFAVRVRSHNTGRLPWRLSPATTAGTHLCYFLFDADDRLLTAGRAGLFDAEVPPGQSVDLAFALPPLPPGQYRLRIDMVEEAHGFFFQIGSVFVEHDLTVTPVPGAKRS